LVPLFFVVLGASLNVRALVQSATDLELAAALIVGMVAVHVLAAQLIHSPVWTGLIVTAQLGVPAAVAKLGLADGVLHAGQGAAIIIGALASLVVCAAGTSLAKRSMSSSPRPTPPPPSTVESGVAR
jgi:Kef-type K+ transport system membrane component KefB